MFCRITREVSPVSGDRQILLFGGSGQVGWELRRALSTLGEVSAPSSARADFGEPEKLRAVVQESRPDLVVNAAAYTAVDGAEKEPELAMAVNGVAPGVLAEEAGRVGAALVHYSTDYVFDGGKAGPYVEDDGPAPINVYGESKLAGENAVADSGADYLVLRTSWVYGMRGKNFLRTILRLAGEREELKVVDDQLGAPTWSRAIAEATAQILARSGGDFAGFLGESGGLYHLAAGGETSWYGFARRILDLSADRSFKLKELSAIPTEEYPTPAARPASSTLSCEKLEETFDLSLPSWEAQLGLCLDTGGALAG